MDVTKKSPKLAVAHSKATMPLRWSRAAETGYSARQLVCPYHDTKKQVPLKDQTRLTKVDDSNVAIARLLGCWVVQRMERLEARGPTVCA